MSTAVCCNLMKHAQFNEKKENSLLAEKHAFKTK